MNLSRKEGGSLYMLCAHDYFCIWYEVLSQEMDDAMPLRTSQAEGMFNSLVTSVAGGTQQSLPHTCILGG